MESRGGVTGGATLTDFLQGFAREGYQGSFIVQPDGRLLCASCRKAMPPGKVPLHSMRRVEGVSDPDDMSAIAALECPECGQRGTATFCVGARCPAEDGIALKALDNQRFQSRAVTDAEADHSLVSDTGWLQRPNDR